MKIDIEGSDIVCLKALQNFLLKPDYISFEAERFGFNKFEEQISLVAQQGYTRFKAIQQAIISTKVVPNPSQEGKFVSH